MQTNDNTKLVRSMYECFNSRNFHRAISLVTKDFEWMNVPFGARFTGPDGALEFLEGWARAIPDSRVTLSNVIGAGDHVFTEFFFRGTHQGTLEVPGGQLAPTGKRVDVPVCEIVHCTGGKIATIRTYFDAATLMRELGLMPAMGAMQGSQQPAT
jgi:steroid delta-isomerase-like uncharacterized protein